MLIRFECIGGFSGMSTIVTLDTFPSERAHKLHELDMANFFNLPEKFPTPKRGADYFQYRLTMEIDRKKHTMEMSESAIPAAL